MHPGSEYTVGGTLQFGSGRAPQTEWVGLARVGDASVMFASRSAAFTAPRNARRFGKKPPGIDDRPSARSIAAEMTAPVFLVRQFGGLCVGRNMDCGRRHRIPMPLDLRHRGNAMPTILVHHKIKDQKVWLASPNREPFFASFGVTNIRTFLDPQDPTRVGLLSVPVSGCAAAAAHPADPGAVATTQPRPAHRTGVRHVSKTGQAGRSNPAGSARTPRPGWTTRYVDSACRSSLDLAVVISRSVPANSFASLSMRRLFQGCALYAIESSCCNRK